MGSKRKHQPIHESGGETKSKSKSESKKKRARKNKSESIVKETSPTPELLIKQELNNTDVKPDVAALECLLQEGEFEEPYPFDNSETAQNSEDGSTLEPYSMLHKVEPAELTTWPTDDLAILLGKMDQIIPAHDNLRFKSRLSKLDWESLRFGDYSSDQCRQMWDFVQKHVRCYRLLHEIISDAKAWVSQPWTSYRNQKKKPHPEMPRRPLTCYMIYYMRNKSKVLKKNPKMDMPSLSKHIAEMYKNLSPTKKEKYMKMASEQREEYFEKLQEFYRKYPELAPKRSKRQLIALNVPKKPFKIFYESKLKDADEKIDRNLFLRKCKRKWKNLSDKQKYYWIDLALSQTGTFKPQEGNANGADTEVSEYKKKMQNLLTKEERHLKEKLAGKPDKPPSSAYGLFSRNMLATEEIKKSNPKERIIKIAQAWKQCSAEEKEAYKEKTVELINQYKLEYTAYLESLTEEERLQELVNTAPKPKTKKKASAEDASPAIDEVPIEDTNSFNVPSPGEAPATKKAPKEKRDKPKKKKAAAKAIKVEAPEPVIEEQPEPEILMPNEPEPPPSSPYELFTKKMLKSEPNTKKKKLEDTWYDLSIKEKESYRKKLDKLKNSYIVKYEQFLKSLTPEQLKRYSSMKATQKAAELSSSDDENEDDSGTDEDDQENSDEDCESDGLNNTSDEEDEDSDSSE